MAWRAVLQGWHCIYAPSAVSYHVRSVVPGNRWSIPAAINMHSVKNRFLMRIKNASPELYRRYLAAHDAARSVGDRRIAGGRTGFATGILASGEMSAPRLTRAPRNHAPPQNRRCDTR